MNFKKVWIGLLTILSSLFISGCNVPTGTSSSGIPVGGTTIALLWNKLLWIGTLGFLGGTGDGPAVGFLRIMMVILIFAILFEGSRLVGIRGAIGGVVAGIIAIMTAVFMPGTILVGIATAYSTLVSFVLIGIPVFIGGYALYRIPGTSRMWIMVRMIVIVGMIVLLYQIAGHASVLLNQPPSLFVPWFGP